MTRLALGLLALAACASRVRVDDLAPLAGVTLCRHGVAFSLISTDALGTDDEITVPPHEAMHRLQRTRFGSCEAMDRVYQTTTGKLAIEAEAYAAGYCAGVKAGLDTMATRVDMQARLRWAMRGRLPDVLTDAAFTHYAGACR